MVVASRNTLKYDDVYNQSGATNTTVYCGGIQSELTGQLFLGRLFWIDLIKWVSNVRPSMCTYVCPSTKRLFDFNEIWYVGRGRWVMQRADPRSRSRSRAMQSWRSFHFQTLSSLRFTMGAGNWPLTLKLGHNIYIWPGPICDICPSFCVTWLWTWQKYQLRISLFYFCLFYLGSLMID